MREAALIAALAEFREQGDLKVRIVAPHTESALVRRVRALHGFTFSRSRAPGHPAPRGHDVLEFYTDLYYQPPPAPAARDSTASSSPPATARTARRSEPG